MILVDDNFATIVSAIEEGKSIYCNIKNFLRFQLTTSVATLTLVAAATLFGFPLPLNPIQILWINVIMDGPPAQSLGVEPLDHEVMARPPRRRTDRMFSREMMCVIVLSAALMVGGTLLNWYVEFYHDEHSDMDPLKRSRTVSFTTFVFFQMFNAANCRSETKSVFAMGLLRNRFFVLAITASVAMQLAAVYVPLLQRLFETIPLSGFDLLYCALVASSVFVLDELRKLRLLWRPAPVRVRNPTGQFLV
eukprot:TRINITY_DN18479_c0_g1_i1.p2 TRINITY_DN18479_c0_g1~~TRINITY_DN18479_c0_g1_i1.p2  ORF type:complete len:268 (+),score=113.25 TRINITY_DN18479_c0_g1_i1:60-806(+)